MPRTRQGLEHRHGLVKKRTWQRAASDKVQQIKRKYILILTGTGQWPSVREARKVQGSDEQANWNEEDGVWLDEGRDVVQGDGTCLILIEDDREVDHEGEKIGQ